VQVTVNEMPDESRELSRKEAACIQYCLQPSLECRERRRGGDFNRGGGCSMFYLTVVRLTRRLLCTDGDDRPFPFATKAVITLLFDTSVSV